MLIRPHDNGSDDESRWRAFVEHQGFGHFVAGGADRPVPVVVPTQFLLDGKLVVFHLARPNPVFLCLAENPTCLLSVAGDWAYIPGAWKAVGGEDPRWGIPTTYYGAVQLTCTATIVDEAAALAAILAGQLGSLEPDGDYVDPIDQTTSLKGIRGIMLTIDEVRAKFKYGGNVDAEHRDHVSAHLAERNGPGDLSARTHMTS
jgi:transcriptional regulator